ncbi:hypothetical protein ACET3Z_017170 [Daucus carota]
MSAAVSRHGAPENAGMHKRVCSGKFPTMDLPAELLAEIVSRTPARTIVYCKSVCKKWRNILSESYFANLHLSRSSEEFIIHQGSRDDEYAILTLIELEDESEQHDIHPDPLMRFDLGLNFECEVMCLSGSVNGLICIEDNYEESVYICNPITQEYIYLENPDTKKSYLSMHYGFGFAETNNQYKVVRFYLDRCLSTENSCPSTEGSYKLGSEVYTLGTATWRDLGHIPFHISGCDIGIYVSGNLHWLADEDKIICTFDLDREIYQPMAAAPWGSENAFRSLGVLKGCLCICDNTPYSELAIWVMRDYGVEDSWTKEFVTYTHLIHGDIHTDMIRILKVFKDGTVLLYSESFQLFTYHPQHQTLQHHIYPGGDLDTFDAQTYVPNFMSLHSFELEEVFGW